MPVVSSGLLLEYRFDEGSGQTVTDYSGNGYHGTLGTSAGDTTNDPTWISEGLRFGSASRVRTGISTGSLPTSAMTFMVLCRLNSASGTSRLFGTSSGTYPTMYVTSGNPSWGYITASGSGTLVESSPVPVDWIVLTLTITAASSQKLYRNELGPVASATSSLSWSPSGFFDLGVGYEWFGAESFNGDMGYFLLYDRQLSDAEVVDNFEAIRTAVASRGIGLYPANPATSYSNAGGTGDRTSTITASKDSGAWSFLVNGVVSETGGEGLLPAGSASGQFITFDFGSGASKLITEAKWYQSSVDIEAVWQWQGSNDGSSWTDIGNEFTLGGSKICFLTQLGANTAGYRYYRMLGVSGTTNTNPDIREIEFRIGDYSAPAPSFNPALLRVNTLIGSGYVS